MSVASRVKMSVAHRGTRLSSEHIRRSAEAHCGLHRSLEQRERIRQAALRRTNGGSFLGRHHTGVSKEKMRKAHLGKPFSDEHKRNLSRAGLGHSVSEETKQRMSKALRGQVPWIKGKHHSPETVAKMRGRVVSAATRQKMSVALRGHLTSEATRCLLRLANLGNVPSADTRRKISEANRGEKSYLWRGGISYEPYSLGFTRALKRSVRERDNYTCQLCGARQSDRAFDVHHIDYNKKNCNPANLVTLCASCHSRTNYAREFWIGLFACWVARRSLGVAA